MKLFGWLIEHDKSTDGRWDLTVVVSRPAGNPLQPERCVTTQVHYNVRFGLMTVVTAGCKPVKQLIVGSHSWTFAKIA